ncbi:Na+/H+ antiporter subunit D [Vibrio sp. SCSIO 43135]|uniref:Na+/H+ antiporter subunit D n=1 Tax=Vibrio paucivorans TaxID=2829489 RepID=A0A9X3CET7_9VIBR|nr:MULTISPECIES: Na+/H+ antiporter subunit D [Vibrio]MCW8334432.1 Na+/H+ antiporter subunit D [Vibrio paucivorans]USD40054.1 Na+/H+ antiporter subunit D [Vibrio sp. SCSIO 43135]
MMLLMPVLIPMLAAALSMVLWKHQTLQRWISVFSNFALLIAAVTLFNTVYNDGIQVITLGGWEAPFGISLVADLLAVVMVTVSAVVAFCISIYALATMTEEHEKFGFYPLLHLMLAGVVGSFLTGDIFNLYVWFEIMLVASFGLLILGGERSQMEGALKYVTLNLLSSALFLSAIGLLYAYAGTLSIADLGQKLAGSDNPEVVTVISLLFLVAFGIKAAAFPLFFWLPASYHTPPVAISAVFAGLLTKVGVYALYRVFSVVFVGDLAFTHNTLLMWMGIFTMVTGVLGAAAQYEVRRILSFHIVSQIGYMILGLALFTPLAILGGVFYLFHHIIVKTNLFLIGGVMHRLHGSYQLDRLGGLYKSAPFLAILFAIPAMSLAGIPPLSGFFAKFVVIKAGIEAKEWIGVIASLAVGLLTMYSMIKIWAEAFWKKLPEDAETLPPMSDSERLCLYLPIILMAILTVTIGINAQWFVELASMTADQILDPQQYIQAVLGG